MILNYVSTADRSFDKLAVCAEGFSEVSHMGVEHALVGSAVVAPNDIEQLVTADDNALVLDQNL